MLPLLYHDTKKPTRIPPVGFCCTFRKITEKPHSNVTMRLDPVARAGARYGFTGRGVAIQ